MVISSTKDAIKLEMSRRYTTLFRNGHAKSAVKYFMRFLYFSRTAIMARLSRDFVLISICNYVLDFSLFQESITHLGNIFT